MGTLTRKLPLRFILVAPFVLQIFAAVGLVGYLSFKNGQKAVNELAIRLNSEISNRVEQHLDAYLAIPHEINQLNAHAIEMGLLDPQNLKATGRYIWKQAKIHQNLSYIGVHLPDGREAGAGRWVAGHDVVIDELTDKNDKVYIPDAQGNHAKLLRIDKYDFLTNEWYIATLKAGKSIWSRIYTLEGYQGYVAATASHPLYNQNHKLVATLSVDLLLSDISQFLRQLNISPSGRVFVIARDGTLAASSGLEKPYKIVNGETKQISVLESPDSVIQALAKQLLYKFGSFQQIKGRQQLELSVGHSHEFVQVTPWRDEYGLDWLVIVAVPESDFMSQINANTRTTIFLCLGALGLATLLGILTSRWITLPILRLSEASIAFAAGKLDQKVEVKAIKELAILAQSFNQMAVQLQDSFTSLEKTNEELEQRVEHRTAELKSAKVAADVANRAKSEFLANMSHELRTPLNGILGYAQILQRDKTANPKQKDGLSIIYQCGHHLLTLINDVLDISKIEARKLEIYPLNFHFDTFLRGVQEICRIKAEQKEIKFNYLELNQLPVAISADEKRLRQVLINLLGNAIKFTDRGSVTFKVGVVTDSEELLNLVQLESQTKDVSRIEKLTIQKIRFQVEDTGIGMTSEQLQKIFLPFEQVGERNRKAEGTGLGLAISHQIVEIMGSKINVESTLGAGSKFWFDLDLPVVDASIELELPKLNQNAIAYAGKQRSILVVDDRWENRSVIVNLLEPIGFKLIEAGNGQEGLDKAIEFQPDLIISDLTMPVMDGLEMVQRLRELKAFKNALMIASSASVFSFDRQQSRDAGYNDFLPKPVQISQLLEQLQHYLGLEWIYQTDKEFTDTAPLAKAVVNNLILPPAEKLVALYQAANAGYIVDIQHEANRLKQLDPTYAVFAEQVLKLAEEFNDEAIVNLVKPYMS